MKRGRKRGEDREIQTLGTKRQPRRTSEVDALLKWMPDLLGRVQSAQLWTDPDRHPHVPALLLRTLAPLLEAVAEALDGKPARLKRLNDQILSTGTRRKRTIAELNETLRPLMENPAIEWLPDGSTTATLAQLYARLKTTDKRGRPKKPPITKPGLRGILRRFGIRYGVPRKQ
jgi:hypothetical protein